MIAAVPSRGERPMRRPNLILAGLLLAACSQASEILPEIRYYAIADT